MEANHGKIFSESESPRAVIFNRGFKNATSQSSIIKLMRDNNITAIGRKNNITKCDGYDCIFVERGYWDVIGVRGDVINSKKDAYGVIDTKIVSGKEIYFYLSEQLCIQSKNDRTVIFLLHKKTRFRFQKIALSTLVVCHLQANKQVVHPMESDHRRL